MSSKDIDKNKKKYSFKKLIKSLIQDKKLYTYVTNTQYYYIKESNLYTSLKNMLSKIILSHFQKGTLFR